MKISSPLRYPGGKASMTGLLADIRSINRLGDRAVAEPFAGGAGASLSLLYLEETPEIYINDADIAIHDFWWTVINRSKLFLANLNTTAINIEEWCKQREIYRSSGRVSRLRRGFAAFYLNRCNRSGIIVNGGPIGGKEQNGTWKLNARYNKLILEKRCKKIAEYRQRIRVSNMDAIDFILGCDLHNTFFFIDPPYYVKGKMLYLDKLGHNYHEKLATQLQCLKDAAWVMTYDDCLEIRNMYAGWANIRSISLQYTASERRYGQEILITPKWMKLPKTQTSASIKW